jgi:hypothetical protein
VKAKKKKVKAVIVWNIFGAFGGLLIWLLTSRRLGLSVMGLDRNNGEVGRSCSANKCRSDEGSSAYKNST